MRQHSILFRSRKIRTHITGEGTTLHRGRGIDVTDIGLYLPGDDTRDISWKHSARTTDLVKKIRSEAETFPIRIINTLSEDETFFTRDAPVSSYAYSINIQDAIIHSAKKYRFPIQGPSHSRNERNTMIFILGKTVDIVQYTPYFPLAIYNDVIVIGITHPEERNPRKSLIFSGFSLRRKSYMSAFIQKESDLKKALEHQGISFLSLTTDTPPENQIHQFFKLRNTYAPSSRTPS